MKKKLKVLVDMEILHEAGFEPENHCGRMLYSYQACGGGGGCCGCAGGGHIKDLEAQESLQNSSHPF